MYGKKEIILAGLSKDRVATKSKACAAKQKSDSVLI
jgi:hypothetical protein